MLHAALNEMTLGVNSSSKDDSVTNIAATHWADSGFRLRI